MGSLPRTDALIWPFGGRRIQLGCRQMTSSTITPVGPFTIGLDNGGTSNNVTVLDAGGNFLIPGLMESPSDVTRGPEFALEALVRSVDGALAVTRIERSDVASVGLASPGPASPTGVISSRGSTNFVEPRWRSFDYRGALEDRLGIPVTYINDGNAAALYAHAMHFGTSDTSHSSISAIVGTGLGGGVVQAGRVVIGAAGMAGELGHVRIQIDDILAPGQPAPRCNCGLVGDVESIASLTGIATSLLPFWLTRYPNHPLATVQPIGAAAKQVRGLAEQGDDMALRMFEQQAMAIGRLFSIASNVIDADAYFVGGGVVETSADFRNWFLGRVAHHTELRDEQQAAARFVVVPDGDMAGARGAAIAASAQTASVSAS